MNESKQRKEIIRTDPEIITSEISSAGISHRRGSSEQPAASSPWLSDAAPDQQIIEQFRRCIFTDGSALYFAWGLIKYDDAVPSHGWFWESSSKAGFLTGAPASCKPRKIMRKGILQSVNLRNWWKCQVTFQAGKPQLGRVEAEKKNDAC